MKLKTPLSLSALGLGRRPTALASSAWKVQEDKLQEPLSISINEYTPYQRHRSSLEPGVNNIQIVDPRTVIMLLAGVFCA